MVSYKPKFKERALHLGGKRGADIRDNGVAYTFRGTWRLKSDANEAKKFYQSINSLVRVVKKQDGYWVYAGRRAK